MPGLRIFSSISRSFCCVGESMEGRTRGHVDPKTLFLVGVFVILLIQWQHFSLELGELREELEQSEDKISLLLREGKQSESVLYDLEVAGVIGSELLTCVQEHCGEDARVCVKRECASKDMQYSRTGLLGCSIAKCEFVVSGCFKKYCVDEDLNETEAKDLEYIEKITHAHSGDDKLAVNADDRPLDLDTEEPHANKGSGKQLMAPDEAEIAWRSGLNGREILDEYGLGCPIAGGLDYIPTPADFAWKKQKCHGDHFASVKDGKLVVDCASKAQYSLGDGKLEYKQPVDMKEHESAVAWCDGNFQIVVRHVKKHGIEENSKRLRKNKDHVNMLVIFLDAVSRAHFHRVFDELDDYLETVSGGDEAETLLYEFLRYSIVGANTPPNMYAMMSGYPFPDMQAFYKGNPFEHSGDPGLIENLPKFIKNKWEGAKVQKYQEKGSNSTWLWDSLRREGYVTMKAMDMCPTSYPYPEWATSTWADHTFGQAYCDAAWKQHWSTSVHCVGPDYAHKHVIEYTKQFWNDYKDIPKFAMASFDDGHEDTMSVIKTMEKDLIGFLEHLADNHDLYENTVITIISDHGLGFGKIARMDVGRLEQRLPTMMMMFPPWLLDEATQDVVEENQQSLVTGFDFHRTLNNLGNIQLDKEGHLMVRDSGPVWSNNILEPIPLSRNCKDAGVNHGACACSKYDKYGWSETGDVFKNKGYTIEPQ